MRLRCGIGGFHQFCRSAPRRRDHKAHPQIAKRGERTAKLRDVSGSVAVNGIWPAENDGDARVWQCGNAYRSGLAQFCEIGWRKLMRRGQCRNDICTAQSVVCWYPDKIASTAAQFRILQNHGECIVTGPSLQRPEIGYTLAPGGKGDVRPGRRKPGRVRRTDFFRRRDRAPGSEQTPGKARADCLEFIFQT